MDFDWTHSHLPAQGLVQKEVEEAFEDPFNIRLLPDSIERLDTRYYTLGRSAGGVAIFSVFWTDGKRYRVIFARQMTVEEEAFYDRKNLEFNA